MDGTFGEAESFHGCLRGSHNLLLRFAGLTRRRDVDGLLEERAVERIRLVEKRQHAEFSLGEDAFERELAAFNEGFHLKKSILIFVQARDLWIGEQGRDPAESRDELRGMVGANHAT